MNLGLRDGWSLGEEVEVATFVCLGCVPGEYRPVATTVRSRRRAPRGAATGQFSLIYRELQATIRNVERYCISVPYEGERASDV